MNPISQILNGVKAWFQRSARATQSTVFSAIYTSMIKFGVPASVAAVIGELVTGIVMMFVGLFMIDAVNKATALNTSSVFVGIQTSLVTTTGTIFSVLGLVIIVIALATAIGSLKNMF